MWCWAASTLTSGNTWCWQGCSARLANEPHGDGWRGSPTGILAPPTQPSPQRPQPPGRSSPRSRGTGTSRRSASSAKRSSRSSTRSAGASKSLRSPRCPMPEPQQNAMVVPVSLGEPLEPLAVESRCTHVLLVVTLGGRFVGDVILPATGSLSPEDQRRAIHEHLGEQLWRLRLQDAFTRAARGSGRSRPHRDPPVSVLVGAGRYAGRLSELLESLTSLQPPA